MKIQLDTTAKTIRIDESCNLEKLFNTLESLLPNGQWKEFTIETTSVKVSNPIIIREYPQYPYRWPWYQWWPTLTSVSSETTFKPQLNPGKYNLKIE